MILFLLDARPFENNLFEIVTHTSHPSTKQTAKLKSLLSCPQRLNPNANIRVRPWNIRYTHAA